MDSQAQLTDLRSEQYGEGTDFTILTALPASPPPPMHPCRAWHRLLVNGACANLDCPSTSRRERKLDMRSVAVFLRLRRVCLALPTPQLPLSEWIDGAALLHIEVVPHGLSTCALRLSVQLLPSLSGEKV